MEKIAAANAKAIAGNAAGIKSNSDGITKLRSRLDIVAKDAKQAAVARQEIQVVIDSVEQLANQVAGIQKRQADIEAADSAVSETPDGKIDIPDKVLNKFWLYYTSESCGGCREVDAKIAALIDKGYPIVVHNLKAERARIEGVPRIYIPNQDREIRGIKNCKVFLASLLSR